MKDLGAAVHLQGSKAGRGGPRRLPWDETATSHGKSLAASFFARFAERLSFITIPEKTFTTNLCYHHDQKTMVFLCHITCIAMGYSMVHKTALCLTFRLAPAVLAHCP